MAGAFVRVAPAELSISSASTFVGSTSTDDIGFYRVLGDVPAVYDLTFVLPGGRDGRSDVLVYRGVGYRYIEPQLDVPGRSLPRSWRS